MLWFRTAGYSSAVCSLMEISSDTARGSTGAYLENQLPISRVAASAPVRQRNTLLTNRTNFAFYACETVTFIENHPEFGAEFVELHWVFFFHDLSYEFLKSCVGDSDLVGHAARSLP
jgi:hypothetical protein